MANDHREPTADVVKRIRDTIRANDDGDGVARDRITTVAADDDHAEAVLDDLEKRGVVYLVNGRVRLTHDGSRDERLGR